MAGSRWPPNMPIIVRSAKPKLAIFEPTFNKIGKNNFAMTQRLKEAFYKVERRYPGFSQDFMMGLLQRMGVNDEIDVTETCLRMAAFQEYDYPKNIQNPRIVELMTAARSLKSILSTIPDEITDRRAFIDVIKEIAGAIKLLLDTVSASYDSLPSSQKKCLEEQKRKFITYCRKFSDTLKQYFKNNDQTVVFSSANLLVNQTNFMLFVVQDIE